MCVYLYRMPGQSYELPIVTVTPKGSFLIHTPRGRFLRRLPKTPAKSPLSDIVVSLKTPVRTPGGRILKSVSDRILRSPGTKQDHDTARLIVSTVPARGQVLLEKKLNVVHRTNPGLWSKFKRIVHSNKTEAIAIAAIIGSLSFTAILRGMFPNSAAAGIIATVTKGIRRYVNGRTPLHLRILEERYRRAS